jgi:hypothetical protein
MPHFTEGGVDQVAVTERHKKKTLLTNQNPGETTTELLLKYQHQDWMLEELT